MPDVIKVSYQEENIGSQKVMRCGSYATGKGPGKKTMQSKGRGSKTKGIGGNASTMSIGATTTLSSLKRRK